MGVLSAKQIEYITKLIARNAIIQKALAETSNEDAERLLQNALSKPLNEPMTGSEEGMRRRLRKKARKSAMVLALLKLAGLTPFRENGNYKDLVEYIDAISSQFIVELTHFLERKEESMLPLWIAARINDYVGAREGKAHINAQQPILPLSPETQDTAQQKTPQNNEYAEDHIANSSTK